MENPQPASQAATTDQGVGVILDLTGYDRIRDRTPNSINERITQQTEQALREYGYAGEATLSRRIDALEHEWDIDRSVMLGFAMVGTLVYALAASARNPKWLWVNVAQFGFLAYHATAGWCPPSALLRRFGMRSRKEIEAERYALKTLRGDFVRP